MINEELIRVEHLKMYFPVTGGILKRQTGTVKAVDDISFSIAKGETLGLVGESGCGKSTTGRSILQLTKATSGRVFFQGDDLTKLNGEKLRRMRRHMQLIFQDPFASLDPRMTAADIITEPLVVQGLVKGKRGLAESAAELMLMVELSPAMASRYPHEFSGGQRQRIGIARALASHPTFIVCDEAVSALDVSIQAQVISLLIRLREQHGLTYLFIAHDLAVVRNISDRVAVMYLGKIVEITSSEELYARPLHPYTVSLLSAVPVPDPVVDRTRQRIVLTGDVPSPVDPPSGCPFHPRCPMKIDICAKEKPELRDFGGHWAACHRI